MHLLKPEDKPTPINIVNNTTPNSQKNSRVNTENKKYTWKVQDADNTTESKWKSSEKQVMDTLAIETSSEAQGTSLEHEWDQFNQKLQDTAKAPNTQETDEFKTPLKIHQDTEPKFVGEQSTPMDQEATTSQHAKIIPALPTLESVLKVIEIPPLDVLYIPLHKAVVQRQRKRRRVDALGFSPGDEKMNFVWNDMPFNLAENLTRLSQFTRAYMLATMDKAIEV